MSERFSAGMRMAVGVLALAAVTAASARAQAAQPAPNGPASTAPPDAAPTPLPLADGSYVMGSGITSPKIVQATPAVYPDGAPPHTSCFVTMTIGVDSVPVNLRGMTRDCGAYQAAAIEAVEKSKFEPGLLGQKPVPVRIEVRVHFSPDRSPAIPQIMHNSNSQWDTPPSVLHSVDPSYSEEARRKKITGIVVVSTLINEEGLPTDVRVEKSLGYGLDEEAVKSVSQYSFRPAQKDGRPVATRIQVEVNFQIYR